MKVETILEILETRKKVAQEEGNTTELSLLYELVQMAENYKVITDMVNRANIQR
jgi:hypothetical protein